MAHKHSFSFTALFLIEDNAALEAVSFSGATLP